MRIAAALSNDINMLNVYKRERDNPYDIDEEGNKYLSPYCDLHYVAAEGSFPQLLDYLPWERLKESKKKREELNAQSYRSIGKVQNFGTIFGLTAASLAEDLGWTVEKAQEALDNYFKKFSGLYRWLQATMELGKAQKYISLCTGRRVFVGESNAKGIEGANAIGRKAANSAIQGVAAEMSKLALVYMQPILDRTGSKLVSVVHDLSMSGRG